MFFEYALSVNRYGYSPFEAIYAYNLKNGLYEIKQLKPLLHQFTWFLADQSGNFCGFEQRMPHTKPLIRLKKEESFIMSIDMEGQNWYGTSVLESTVPLWKQWCTINGLTLINFGIDDLVQIQVGNVKQSQKFFERHPTLDPNQNQEQMEELQYKESEDRSQESEGNGRA